MPSLSPLYAANLASDVYGVKSALTRDDFLEAYKSDMEIAKASFVSGVTGGFMLTTPHVMAVFSAGKGLYQGQAFVVFKGTASLYDALTDINTGVKPPTRVASFIRAFITHLILYLTNCGPL